MSMRLLTLQAAGGLSVALTVALVWAAGIAPTAVLVAQAADKPVPPKSVPLIYAKDTWPPKTKLSASNRALSRVLELGAGSCLRGPLQVFDAKGQVLFALDATASYPFGCADQPDCPPVWKCTPKGDWNDPDCEKCRQ